ncbi:uncharacterized protein [Leuresthes tenuis]|uniref:uncharacterized protein n=1 Tax=Leuresthes tenuis TaxID=355514 RepID=UPI003B502A49
MTSMELNGSLNGNQIDMISNMYIVSLTLSVIGSFSVLVVSIVRWRNLREQVHLLVQLALADLLAALILMFTSVMNKVTVDRSVTICQYMLPLSLTFYFISILLVAVYACKSMTAVQGWRERAADDEDGQSGCRGKTITLSVYGIVWLIPLAMYLTYVLTPFMTTALVGPTSDSTYCTSCILFLHLWRDPCSDAEKFHDIFIRVFLFLVVILVTLSCSVINYKVGKWYAKHEHDWLFPVEGDGRSRKRMKSVISTARNMLLVILICWIPALVLILLSTLVLWTNIEQHSLFGLYMIQAATVSLQGFLNSMVYAWKRPNFTEAVLGENTPLVAYNRIAFFDESLRNSNY